MTKFLKNLILCFLTISVTANAVNKNKATDCLTKNDIPNALKQVEQINQETVAFIDDLNTALPQIIQDINSSKTKLSATVLKTILGTYKEVKLMELIKAMLPLKKNNLDDRLLPLAGYLAIEALLLKSVSNLKMQKTSEKNSKLNKTIDGHIKEIREKSVQLRTTLNNSLIKYLHLSKDLNQIDATKAKKAHDVKEILEEFNYKKLPEILEVKSKKLKEEFYDSIQKTASCLLTPSDQITLKAFVKGPMFQKMKTATNSQAFTNFSGTMLSSLPTSTQNLINQAKTTILVTE